MKKKKADEPSPANLSNIHYRLHWLAREMKGLAHLLAHERSSDPDLAVIEAEAREGIGRIAAKLAAEARELTNEVDEYIVQDSKRRTTK